MPHNLDVKQVRRWIEENEDLVWAIGASLAFAVLSMAVYALYVKIGRPKVTAAGINEVGDLVVEMGRKGVVTIPQDVLVKTAFASIVTTKDVVLTAA